MDIRIAHLSNLQNRGGKTPRDRSGFEVETWTGPIANCLECGKILRIKQHRERTLQTLDQKLMVSARDTGCGNPLCSNSNIYRPIEESKLALPKREFGLDVVCLVLEKHLGEMSLASIHKILTEEYGVKVSQTHVGNLLRLGLAMVHARNLESDSLREKLRGQGGIILSIDAVVFGERASPFYVMRDVISSEFLLAERLETRRAVDLIALFEKVKALDIPVLGIVSDKEAAFLTAAEKVFPEVPHQICQTHYLLNLAKPLESTSAALGRGVKATVQAVRGLELELLKQQDLEFSEAEKKEREVALKLCTIVRAGGKIRGDKLLDPTPLKRQKRLVQAAEATKKAIERPDGTWPVLTKLLASLSLLGNFQKEANRLVREVGVLRQIAHILKIKLPGEKVQAALQAFLDQVDEDSSNELALAKEKLVTAEGMGKSKKKTDAVKVASAALEVAIHWRTFVEHVTAVSARFWKGLFHCYEHSQLPSTNNAMEAFFGVLKRLSRKTTGRRSTSGGPLETCPEFFIEAFTLLRGCSRAEIIAMLGDIPDDEIQKAILQFEELAEPVREKRSIVRDPEAALEKLLEDWSKTPPSES